MHSHDMQQKDYAVMGMEKDSTWVLNGPFLDKTLMRNTQSQSKDKKEKVSKEQLIGMLSATSNLLDEREDFFSCLRTSFIFVPPYP